MARLSGTRVLLVEDNEMNQELAIDLLGKAGIEAVLARHGQEALDILAQDARFDGVLMDCQMPVMDGFQASRAIRANPALDKLPIIAMTANAMAGDREKVLASGMQDHIAKPVNVAEMYATLARWLRPAPGEGQAGMLPAASNAHAASVDAAGGKPAPLPALPMVDVRAGLATSMGDEKLYRRLLVKFRDGQQDFAAMFVQALMGGDATAPERLAHTLKGVAGTRCAQRAGGCAGAGAGLPERGRARGPGTPAGNGADGARSAAGSAACARRRNARRRRAPRAGACHAGRRTAAWPPAPPAGGQRLGSGRAVGSGAGAIQGRLARSLATN